MHKIPLMFGLVSCLILVSAIGAYADDCPSGRRFPMSGACADSSGNKVRGNGGNIQFPNAQGQSVTIKRATTYAGCVRNGHTLGYAQAQIEAYCHQHYAQ
jgi:hypothetical protein